MQDVIIDSLQPLLDAFQEKTVEKISETIKMGWERFVASIKNRNADILNLNVTTLDKARLVEIAHENKVDGSTEVAALKVVTENVYIIYLAYTKDRELIDTNSNKYIIITTQFLARDIEKLFDKDELILLK